MGTLVLGLFSCQQPTSHQVQSPDKRISATVETKDGQLYYSVQKDGRDILLPSLLGFELQNQSPLKNHLRIEEVNYRSHSSSWEQLWGEELSVDETYEEMRLLVKETRAPKRHFYLNFRLFNDGIGFRYEFPEQENLSDFVIMDELTEFAFTENHQSWSIPYDTEAYEGLYRPMPINALDTVCSPLTMVRSDGLHLALHEANLTDYAGLNLHPRGSNTLKVWLTPWSTGEKVFMKAPHNTPWRTLIIADNAGDLLLSRLMLKLNEPNQIEDPSWIKPGRYLGIWWGMHMNHYTWHEGPDHGATTQNAKRYIDFAAQHNFSGVLVEGWNKGWDDWASFSFTEAYPGFDLEEVTRYAAQKGVGLIGHHETGGNVLNYEAQIDDAFALYQKHGVNTVKTGYVGTFLNGKEYHSSQYAVRHYRNVIEKAAQHHIMINNHEPAMPTGLQRTWPNLMTQEGVRGQEWNAWAKDGGNPPNHATIIPFTRGLAGPMDFTPGIFNFENPAMPGTRVNTTLAKQLALAVVLYSPLQMAADMIENYQANPAPFEFVKACPVNWERTLVPHAQIGAYLTTVRKDRESDNWYLGSITNEEARTLELALDFLDANATYTARIYRDAPDAHYQSKPYAIRIEEQPVTAQSTLTLQLAPGGGTAIELVKN